ncbi:hypothetical protein BJY16_008372 [Actinoplanes octamycinicus]|uniref:Uncharacterized protein n=1 Tax=Actinoplanes octamycinicus TaxID=135948 RepID=A0A7W7H6J0_9ACTN|nr:hypothetical protein [Actinoplanes octamycinicus]
MTGGTERQPVEPDNDLAGEGRNGIATEAQG